MKKALSLLLTMLLVLSVIPIVQVSASSYAGDWKHWSQGGSDYWNVRQYGCWIVAMTKLLYETNVERSINPDDFYNWECQNGLLVNPPNNTNQTDGGNAPVYYANQRGRNLEYLGQCGTSDAELWSFINAGYYTILHVRSDYEHYVYIDNALSKSTGQLYCMNSITDSGYADQKLISDYPTRVESFVYKSNGNIPVSVSFNPNGGVINGKTSVQSFSVYAGDTLNLGIPQREGYEFDGYTQSGGGELFPRTLYSSYGKPVYNDATFYDSVAVYNNKSNGTVTHSTMNAETGSPSVSGKMIKITTGGEADPGLGGFMQLTTAVPGGQYYHVFKAKVPVGYTLCHASNELGYRGTRTWLTDNKGTGKWETYVYRLDCGYAGKVGTFGHVYLKSDTGSTTATWYLCASNIYIATEIAIGQYSNPNFSSEYGLLNVYNNNQNGTVTVTRVAKNDATCPSIYSHYLQVQTSGSAAPGLGGVFYPVKSKPNGVFYQVMVAKIPVGYTLERGANACGDGATFEWVTDNKGTGNWETYICKTNCGKTGEFSTLGFWYIRPLNGQTSVTWYVCFTNIFDSTPQFRAGTANATLTAQWREKAPENPPAPQNVAAKPTGNKAITVSWSAVSGATQYNIYRYNGSTKSYGYKGTTFATAAKPTQYIDSGLTAGTTYYYKVVAVNKSGGETQVSDMSAYASAKAVASPAVPTGVAVKATASKALTVSWKAVPGATQYNIYRYNGSTKAYGYKGTTFATAAKPTQYVDSGLSAGTTYYYKVVSVTKDAGVTLVSAQSASASAKVVGTPAVPTGVAVKPTADKTLTISWTAVKNATQYNIYRYNGSTKSYAYKGTTFATAAKPTQYIDKGLTAGATYYYRVVAVTKDAGLTLVSDKSAAASAKAIGTPAVPDTVTATGGTGKITLLWTESTGATQYNVYRYNGAKNAYVYKGTSYSTSYADTTVTAGTTYYYKVVPVTKSEGLTLVGAYSASVSAKAK